MTCAINALNAGADCVSFVFRKAGMMTAPTILGAVGGRLVGAGWQVGALQGLISGVFYSWVVSPINAFVERNRGNDEGQIHNNTASILWYIGTIASIAVPIIVTVYGAGAIFDAAHRYAPPLLSRFFTLDPSLSTYNTAVRGLLVNIAPFIAQHLIGSLRSSSSRGAIL